MREDRADAINAFRALNGAEDIQSHETVFQFSGTTDQMRWSAGTGLSLRDALSPRSDGRSVHHRVLDGRVLPDDRRRARRVRNRSRRARRRHRPLLRHRRGAGARDLCRRGVCAGLLEPLGGDAAGPRAGRSRFEFELGGLVEDGGVLGTLAAGGLKLSEQAATAWASATSQTALDEHWSLKASLTVAAAGVQHPGSSLIAVARPGLCDELLVRHRRQGSARARRCAGVRHRAAAQGRKGAGDADDGRARDGRRAR